MSAIPDKPSLDGLEEKWDGVWESAGVYTFDRTRPRDEIYAIDTPPPTISGFLHLGTAFGYIQVDAVARFHRMRGREPFYPMGWDDNGLPTERRVQNHYGVRCDPTLPYEPDFRPEPVAKNAPQRPVSRPNFVELCRALTEEFEGDFENQWRRVGLSVDWGLTYATIDDRCRRVAQRGFLANLARGDAYSVAAPTLWDIDFQTAVAQAELEDRAVESAYHRLAFPLVDGPDGGAADVEIETTRPELLPACVALVVHPDDARFADLVGRHVRTPAFHVDVPVVAHGLADPEKGTGAAMICTFGDTTDVIWWRELDLPTRPILGRDGRVRGDLPEWLGADATVAWEKVAGLTANQARKSVLDLAADDGALRGEPRKITHEVRFYEKGNRPLEIVTSRQWYIRNGARDQALRERLIARGRELTWHPDFMRPRYEHWVDGLNTDWLISRQRYFGVPFPIWYPVTPDGEIDMDSPIVPAQDALPVDPQATAAPGYDEAQRGEPGGFVGDPDVMDTWATSSLSPQIIAGWDDDPELFATLFPMDLRPQGPEIIRTWLFSTLLRSELEHGVLPWRNTMINGWILDPDRKKMSKSKDNVLTPMPLVDEFGADALRYWCCSSAPGSDTAIDKAQMKIGRRLAVKLLNAARFVLGLGAGSDAEASDDTLVSVPLDRALLARLAGVVDEATTAFERYEYHRALDRTERFFWSFCDDYLELVKQRAGAGDTSARATLTLALDVVLRLLAPFLPFVTEEVWSWWRPGTVHRAPWPDLSAWRADSGVDPAVLDTVSGVLTEVRKAKTAGRRSQRSGVQRLVVIDGSDQLDRLRVGEDDLRRAGSVEDLVLQEGSRSVEVVLAED